MNNLQLANFTINYLDCKLKEGERAGKKFLLCSLKCDYKQYFNVEQYLNEKEKVYFNFVGATVIVIHCC